MYVYAYDLSSEFSCVTADGYLANIAFRSPDCKIIIVGLKADRPGCTPFVPFDGLKTKYPQVSLFNFVGVFFFCLTMFDLKNLLAVFQSHGSTVQNVRPHFWGHPVKHS